MKRDSKIKKHQQVLRNLEAYHTTYRCDGIEELVDIMTRMAEDAKPKCSKPPKKKKPLLKKKIVI
jgi:hypothetical protein